tara:strand:- start:33 stop:302 length:270 start_codon:yes stop_codon:yes gene_type:complete
LETFVGLPISAIDSKLTLRCIESLLAALVDLTKLEPALQQAILQTKDALVQTILGYIHLIARFTLKVEEERGEALEDMQAKRYAKRVAK